MQDIKQNLADAIRKSRTELGLSQEKLGLSTLFQTNFFRLFFRYCTGV